MAPCRDSGQVTDGESSQCLLKAAEEADRQKGKEPGRLSVVPVRRAGVAEGAPGPGNDTALTCK